MFQTNSELSEETEYRYRPVNLLLKPYFLPTPVRSLYIFYAGNGDMNGNDIDICHQRTQLVKDQTFQMCSSLNFFFQMCFFFDIFSSFSDVLLLNIFFLLFSDVLLPHHFFLLLFQMCSSLDIKEKHIHIGLWDLARIRSQRREK